MLRAILLAGLLAVPQFAAAQAASEVKFQPGTSGTTLHGEVSGNAHVDYLLGARAGQEMSVALTVGRSDAPARSTSTS